MNEKDVEINIDDIKWLGDEKCSLNGKKVLVRCDFNVPLDDNNNITDNSRIVAALPTINYLKEKGAKIILCSHLEVKKEARSLEPVARELESLLQTHVVFSRGAIIPNKEEIDDLQDGDIMLLENLRQDKREKSKDENERDEFAKELSSLANVFVFDAFGAAHRNHASTYNVQKFLPTLGGKLVKEEIEHLNRVLNPEKPFVAVFGGAKVADKVEIIKSLLEKGDEEKQVDKIIIGGAMANTFLVANSKRNGTSISMGDSKIEDDEKVETAREILEMAEQRGIKIILPTDFVIADSFSENANCKHTSFEEGIPQGWMALDIGEDTIEKYKEELKGAKTIFWNGPMGVFEFDKFANGTNEISKYMTTIENCYTVVGGGDSADAVKKSGDKDKFSWVSSGGGASIDSIANDLNLSVFLRLAERGKEWSKKEEECLKKKKTNEELSTGER